MACRTFIFSILLTLSTLVFGQNTEIAHLKTDHQTTPLGFDNQFPEFSWILQSDERSLVQTAYEIQVSDNQEKFRGVQTFGIKYAGIDGMNRWSFINRGDLDGQWQMIDTWDKSIQPLRKISGKKSVIQLQPLSLVLILGYKLMADEKGIIND